MVSGLSAALGGMRANSARMDRAATAVARDGMESESGVSETSLEDGMTEMIAARIGFTASLRAAQASTDVLAAAIQLGGYDNG
jgi:hypothetical protein